MPLKIKPRRQMSVQFSGGEPTMSPYFLDAVSYARKIGYNSVQAATNGIEFAKSKEFSKKAFEAGMRYAYLQFDGIGNDANSHRQIGNLFDVKLRAIENMHEAGIEIVLVVTIVNNVNNDQVGTVVKFAMENPKKIAFVSFQPVSFTGRDEDITPERRLRQRYTLSHLAKDVSDQVGKVEPTRDWFPISFISTFAGFADMVKGNESQWGSLSCGCHPNCGVGTALMINKETKRVGAGAAVLERDAAHQRRDRDYRRGARQEFFELHDGDGSVEELSAVRRAEGFDARIALQEIRQDVGADQAFNDEVWPYVARPR